MKTKEKPYLCVGNKRQMAEATKQVTVVIPMYKPVPDPLERRALEQAYAVLGRYPLVVIHPRSLDLSAIRTEFPRLDYEAFDDIFFRGISGYNRLMLSPCLYERFLDSEYILIYQLDAYVFRDELAGWCMKGYDYVGAPWLRKPVYRLPLIKQYMAFVRWWQHRKGHPSKQDLYNKVGNGGLSLRRVASHLNVLREEGGARATAFLERKGNHLYNEDVFWATVPADFHYPEPMEALRFAFDKYPRYCYRLNDKRLPFGCHSWYKRKMRGFWKTIIQF